MTVPPPAPVPRTIMRDVSRWLESLGLGQYAKAFQDNDVEWDLLDELTNDFLKDIGIDSAGHRMRILKAAAAIEIESAPAVSSAPPSPALTAAGEAERRQLTVMFCDLVGSTELSQTLDPEDLREITLAYQDTAKAAIERFDGFVARYMGDGVLAYFGYPKAHEDDAERAVRAGLALVDAIPPLNRSIASRSGVELAVRVGLATGPVVVGDIIGEGASQESAVVGETPNIAARIESTAQPNSVFLAQSTRELVGGAFELEDFGLKALKGIATPTRVYRALGEAQAESRFEAARTAALGPLVAREEELGLLMRRWEHAKEGEGQVILLSGEPGIGKSRIIRALRERLAGEDHLRVQFQCSPYHTNSSLHPIIAHIERAAGFRRDDSPEEKREKLEAFIAEGVSNVAEVAPLFASMLALPADLYPPLDLVPKKQLEKTFQALAGRIEGLAQKKPVLLIFEDAHWADPTTCDALSTILPEIQNLSVLTLITHRPGFDAPWARHGHVGQLSLSRLSRKGAAAMIEAITGGKSLPAEVQDEILAKTDGVPIFVEELTKAVLESNLLEEKGDRYESKGSISSIAIPATLQDSLISRLDHLSTIKEIAQIAACIGREFSFELLATVSGLSESRLADALNTLSEAELVFRRGVPPDAVYTFKHALIRDAAYESMLKQRRRVLHASIAETLERQDGDRLPEIYPLLAHHFEKAEILDKAFEYFCLAAERATRSHALSEAITLYQRSLEISEQSDISLPPDRIIGLHKQLTQLLFAKGLYRDSERQAARMLEFARGVGDSESSGMALVNMANASMWAEDFDEALKLGAEAARLGESTGSAVTLAGGTMITGVIYGLTGRLDESHADLQRSLRISREAGNATYVAPALFFTAMRENWTGRYDEAISLSASGQQVAEEQNQHAWYLRCKWSRGTALVGKGSYDAALLVLREGLEFAEKIGDAAYIPRYMNTLGWLYNECHAFELGADFNGRAVELDRNDRHATGVERSVFSQLNWADALLAQGDLGGAGELLHDAYETAVNPKTQDWMKWRYTTHVLASMAEYWATRGEPAKAREFVDRCLEVATAKNSCKYIAMGQRIAGLVAMHRRDTEAAASALHAAEKLAAEIGHPNELWKARAALAELYERTGDADKSAYHAGRTRELLDKVRESLEDRDLRSHYGKSPAALRISATGGVVPE